MACGIIQVKFFEIDTWVQFVKKSSKYLIFPSDSFQISKSFESAIADPLKLISTKASIGIEEHLKSLFLIHFEFYPIPNRIEYEGSELAHNLERKHRSNSELLLQPITQ